MLDINILEKSGFFKKITLNKGELVFDEGDFDDNIYIILSGELFVEKYTNIKHNETKRLAILKKDDIFGEASLNTNEKKQNKIVVSKNVDLLFINAQKGLSDFTKKHNEQGLNLLKYIIYITNKRVIESNELITINHKISMEISGIEKANNKNLFLLLDRVKDILNIEGIMYYEYNAVLDNYVTLKYNTKMKGKLLDKTVEITDNELDLLSLKTNYVYSYPNKISIGKKILGYFVFLKKGGYFSENDKKLLNTSSTLLAGIIKQKIINEEDYNRKY